MRRFYRHWNSLKDAVQSTEIRLAFAEGDIWQAYLGENIGDEECGSGDDFLRSIVVYRKFNQRLCWIIPMTKTVKISPYYFVFSFQEGEAVSCILSQLRSIDSKRLMKKIGRMRMDDFQQLTEKLKVLMP